MRRLRDARQSLANFLASGVPALEKKLGPILWQVPSDLPFDSQVLTKFCRRLPASTSVAARLAREHDGKLKASAYLRFADDRPVLHALEVRNETYATAQCYDILRNFGVALVVSDGARHWPLLRETTANFFYLRLHGHEELYASAYSSQSLSAWAKQVHGWVTGLSGANGIARNVYAYFDNDAQGHTPHNALSLDRFVRRCIND